MSVTVSLEQVAPLSRGSIGRRLSVGESIIRGALANFSAQPFTWAATLLATIVVPRLLGSEAYGQLTVAFSISGLATTVFDLGMLDYLTRRIAQNPGRMAHDLGTALFIQLATFSTGGLIIAVVAPHVAPALLDWRILYWALVGIVGACTHRLLGGALRGREDHAKYAWLSALPTVGSAVGAALILFVYADVVVYAAVGIILDFVLIALSWKLSGLRPSFPRLDPSFLHEASEFARGGFPFLSWTVTMTLCNGLDRVLLGLLVPASEVGWYGAAYRIIGIPVVVPMLLVTPLFPALSRSTGEPDVLRRAIAQTLKLALFCSLPLSAGIFVLAPLVPDLFGWPNDFANSIPLMLILSLQMPLVAVDMVLGTVLMAIGRERLWLRIGLLATVLNLGSNLVLIPLFEHVAGNGAIGASIVTVITELWMFGGALMLVPKNLLDLRTVSTTARIVLAGVCAAAVAIAALPAALILSFISGFVTYGALVLLLRLVSADDVSYIKLRLLRRAATRAGALDPASSYFNERN